MRVVDGHRVPHLLGLLGTIERTYRTSKRTALHVRLDDGRWQLLWPQEVEPLAEGSETGRPVAGRHQERSAKR